MDKTLTKTTRNANTVIKTAMKELDASQEYCWASGVDFSCGTSKVYFLIYMRFAYFILLLFSIYFLIDLGA